METQLYLISMGDYSPYIRDLIEKDRISKRDPKMIESKLRDLEKQIRDLKQVQTKAKELPTDIDILQKYYKLGKERLVFEGDPNMVVTWARNYVIPELKKAGYTSYDSQMVINKFIMMDKNEGGE